MAGRPFEALAFERLPGIGVRLFLKNELQAVLRLIDLGLPAGECPADKLGLMAQIFDTLAHPADVGVIVGEQIGRKRNGVFAPVLGHGRLDLFHLFRRQLGAALQRLVLAVVGIDRFHHGLLRLHSLQLFCELFHGKVIIGADTASACGADLVQQLFNFGVLAVVAIPGGVLLGLFRHGEIAAPGDQNIVSFIPRAVMQGIPLLYGSTGEILTEKSGNLNLGIPGIMYVGGICGVIGAFFYEQAVPADQMSGFLAILIPMLCSLLGSLLMGLLYCFLTVTLRANQNVTGLTMTTFGVGIGNFFGGSLIKLTGSEVPSIALSATSGYFAKSLPFAKSLGWFGQIFLSYGFLAYLAIILALLSSYFLKHTRPGLHLRSVGESASTADAADINVTRYKYLATCVGSMIAGLGGLYYVMDYASGVWSNNAFGDRGWLAIALVIFTIWRPNVSVLASILFGGLYILYLYIPTGSQMAVKELYKMLPYVVTVVVLVISSLRNNMEKQPPASLGLSYFREER